MKLKNKKTGEVVECAVIPIVDGYVNEYEAFKKGESLAELNEEWEDYEEPKEYWFINSCGAVEVRTEEKQPVVTHRHKQFGNYFETEEEAERVLKKLKAWKRLKDKGVKFTDWNCPLGEIYFKAPDTFFDRPDMLGEAISEETKDDLDLLFGGEE